MNNLNYTIDIENLNIHIEDSYLINSKEEINEALLYIMRDDEYDQLVEAGFTRTRSSMRDEWAAHNLLYHWYLFPKHTKDVDLDQKETPLRKLIYAFLSTLYW